MQAYAAQELYNREWRFHTELKLWVKRASPADAITQVLLLYIVYYNTINLLLSHHVLQYDHNIAWYC
jgi:NOT2 / NOT3 / NOT5 family